MQKPPNPVQTGERAGGITLLHSITIFGRNDDMGVQTQNRAERLVTGRNAAGGFLLTRQALRKQQAWNPAITEFEPGAFKVSSQSHPQMAYTVRVVGTGVLSCNCPARGYCKHIERIGHLLKRQNADPESYFPPVSDPEDDDDPFGVLPVKPERCSVLRSDRVETDPFFAYENARRRLGDGVN